jgi:thioester reductase-like protein
MPAAMLNLKQKQLNAPGQLESLLARLIAQSLGLTASQLDSNTHLSSYGLDSVTAISAITAISDMTGLELFENALLEYPTISSLADHIRTQTCDSGDAASSPDVLAKRHNLMLQDSILPVDILPPAGKTTPAPAAILLTGATGFLGIHLLDVLLANTDAHIYCLIRMPKDNKPYARLKDAFAEYGIGNRDLERRVTVIAGDLDKPLLGITDKTFQHLASSIDSIYHSAADVNWGLDYTSLRMTNVLPVVDLLRLACLHKKKHFVFVSSISVCYAYRGPDSVTEHTPALSLLEDIYLGYAQSKVIAEALCEQAFARGLPVIIHRPALILGNSITGHSNNDDLVSRVIKGCIEMGCAPDIDWLVDACPANEVAEAIYRLSPHGDVPLHVTHLIHSQPRYWRELVLWMNIYGYQIKLLPYSEWMSHLRDECNSISHPLYPLRSFFLHQLPEADGLALPEIYEEHRHSRVVATDTSAALSNMALTYSPLDSGLLERYFGVFTATGFLPETATSTGKAARDINSVLDEHFFSALAHKVFRNPDSRLANIERLPTPTDSSIITDLASWKFGKPSGLFRYLLKDETAHTCEVFIKVKPDDKAVLDVAATVAGLSVRGLDTLFATFKHQTGLAGCHKRELAVYRQRDPRFVRHSPSPYLLVDNDVDQRWIIALEAIERPIFMDARATARRWPSEHIICCINGLAELHSIWFGRESALMQQIPQCNALSADDMENAKPLWFDISRHADSFVTTATGETLEAVRNEIIDSVHKWWSAIEQLDRTLIHNDFNPRNMALVDRQGEPALCAFDWELATLGIPQRDLAEFLCFVLPPDHEKSESMQYIEHHRRMLERASGSAIEPDAWIHGFQLALFDLVISRIPMYTLVHRIRPQHFLRRMTQTWHALFKSYCDTGCL